jgi:hypothetical protein
MSRVIPRQWINMQTGELTLEAVRYLDDMQNGTDPANPGINTVLAGVNRTEAKTDGIIAGTVVLDTITTADAGNIPTALTAFGATAGATSGLSISPATAAGFITGAGAVATNSVTAAATFGTGPWTYAWTLVAGDTFTLSNPALPTTNFSTTLGDGDQKTATYRVTATDSLAATKTADVPVTAFSTPVS